MNITLGITGDMFRSKGLFYTDFLASEEINMNKKRKRKGKFANLDTSSESEEEPETVDPTQILANSMKPTYLKKAIQKDKKVKGFNADIDNFPGVRSIENFLIAALTDENDNEVLETKGMLQIFNKDKARVLNHTLTAKDVRRIDAIQKLLGAAITRAEIYSTCLTTLLGLGMFLDNSQVIGLNHSIIDDDFIHSLYDIANMVPSIDSVKRHLDYYYPVDSQNSFKRSSTAAD